MGVLMFVFEALFGVLGFVAFLKAMARFTLIASANDRDEVMGVWGGQALWSMLAGVSLVACALAGGRTFSVIMVAAMMSLVLIICGGAIAWLRNRKLYGKISASQASADEALVVIRHLVQGNVRGLGDDSEQRVFSQEEIDGLIGLQGRVRMLNWASGRKVLGNGGATALFMFTSADGEQQFILHPNDIVVSAIL